MASHPTLPDLLRPGLDCVFVGINPSLYSVERGHYFSRKTNRFWPAFSRSSLSEPARRAMGLASLLPEHDRLLLAHCFGFTDVAKRATERADEVSPAEFAAGARVLLRKIERFRPRVACFHGVTGFRPVLRALSGPAFKALGPQPLAIGPTRLFVVPSPSPANAHFTPAQQTDWYDRLAQFLADAAKTHDGTAPPAAQATANAPD